MYPYLRIIRPSEMDRRLLLDLSFWSAVKGMLAVTVTSYFFFKTKTVRHFKYGFVCNAELHFAIIILPPCV